MGGHERGQDVGPPVHAVGVRDVLQPDGRRALPGALRSCRNEHVSRTHIHSRPGILIQTISILLMTPGAVFPVVVIGNQIIDSRAIVRSTTVVVICVREPAIRDTRFPPGYRHPRRASERSGPLASQRRYSRQPRTGSLTSRPCDAAAAWVSPSWPRPGQSQCAPEVAEAECGGWQPAGTDALSRSGPDRRSLLLRLMVPGPAARVRDGWLA